MNLNQSSHYVTQTSKGAHPQEKSPFITFYCNYSESLRLEALINCSLRMMGFSVNIVLKKAAGEQRVLKETRRTGGLLIKVVVSGIYLQLKAKSRFNNSNMATKWIFIWFLWKWCQHLLLFSLRRMKRTAAEVSPAIKNWLLCKCGIIPGPQVFT